MTSDRFPQVEILDAIRQLIYVPTDSAWQQWALRNPHWQLTTRNVYSLNGVIRDGDGNIVLDSDGNPIPTAYSEQPVVPEAVGDNVPLIRPQLFDNPTEMFIQATTSSAPLTGVYAQYRDGQGKSLLDTNSNLGIINIETYLWVMNQDNPQSKMLRYFNWFDYVLRFDRNAALLFDDSEYPHYTGIDPLRQYKLYSYISSLRRSGAVSTSISGLTQQIPRIASIGILVQALMEYVDGAPPL